MRIFNFPQFEHEAFWSYLSRLNDYRALLDQIFKNGKFMRSLLCV